MADEKTYEMLWDCRYCGQDRLLGLTHRHCPSCGAPQDADARYFPPDDQKVAVEDHALAGVDVICPACREGTSSHGKHCGHCGSPLTGATAVARRDDVVVPEGDFHAGSKGQAPVTSATPPRKSGRPWLKILIAVVLLGATVVVALFFVTTEVGLTVKAHRWTREVGVERFQEVSESGWCDSLPARARVTSRSQRERSTRRVPDGETCKVRKVDNGNGTFTERRECTPKYREEPVMDAYCSYRVERWVEARRERATGGLSPAPTWPEIHLERTGTCLGCERRGKALETYTVVFAGETGSETTCDLPEAEWRTFEPGSRWIGDQRMTGGLDCSGLRAAH